MATAKYVKPQSWARHLRPFAKSKYHKRVRKYWSKERLLEDESNGQKNPYKIEQMPSL